MMKPQNQRYVILACMMGHISQLHGVEEMRVGQLGTTIYDDGLKDREETQARVRDISTNKSTISNNLPSIPELEGQVGQLCAKVPPE